MLVDEFREEIRIEINAGNIKIETLKKYKQLPLTLFITIGYIRAYVKTKKLLLSF